MVVRREQNMTEEEALSARGVIRREEVPFLTEYGTSYVHYDEEEDAYKYALRVMSTDSASTWVFGRKSVVR